MISLYDVIEASNGQLFGEASAQVFSGFCLDAAHANASEMFVAIKGDYGDTHHDMELAIENGATGILCTQPPVFDTDEVSVVVVKDTGKALMDWAYYILRTLHAKPIVVSGTIGKATTVSALDCVLSTQYAVHAPTEMFGGRFQLPLTLAGMDQTHEFVVLDLNADRPGELKRLVDLIEPEVGVVMNIGQAYLDRFQSVDQIAEDHAVLVDSLPNTGLAVLNYNDDRVRAMMSQTKAKKLMIGVEEFGPDLLAYNVIVGPTQTGFDLRFHDKRYVGKWTTLLGRHQVYSVLAALAVGAHFEVPVEQALHALTELDPLPGRMSPFFGEDGCFIIDDSYGATPESTMAALDWLGEVKDEDTRVIFVFGDMDHLGDATRGAHRLVGQRAVEVADVIVTEGTHAALAGRAAQDIAHNDRSVHITYSIQDAIAALRGDGGLSEQDIVLIKGGASARMEMIARSLLSHPGDHALLPRQKDAEIIAIDPNRPLQPSWIEVDREALANNVRLVKQFIGADVALMAVVKANAYGHGVVTTSRIAMGNGASYLAVASISEALELRHAGIDAPILVLSYTPVYAVREALRYDITITVYDLDLTRAYNQAASEVGGKLRVHVKVDTGMGRLGVMPDDAALLFRYMMNMQNIVIEGLYSHYAVADENLEETEEQLNQFKFVLASLRAGGMKFKYTHIANSAGITLGDGNYFNMVRAGIMLYGGRVSEIADAPTGLMPVMHWKTVIAQVKTLPQGYFVGYGHTYQTMMDEKVAVLPIGYGDGLRRSPSNWGEVLVRGQRAPIRGRVSMEKTVIGVNHIEGVSIGDEVVLLGQQGDEFITIEEIAEKLDTVNYEVLTTVLPRVARQ